MLLPEPDGPTSAIFRPGATRRSTSRSAHDASSAYAKPTPSSATVGSDGSAAGSDGSTTAGPRRAISSSRSPAASVSRSSSAAAGSGATHSKDAIAEQRHRRDEHTVQGSVRRVDADGEHADHGEPGDGHAEPFDEATRDRAPSRASGEFAVQFRRSVRRPRGLHPGPGARDRRGGHRRARPSARRAPSLGPAHPGHPLLPPAPGCRRRRRAGPPRGSRPPPARRTLRSRQRSRRPRSQRAPA